MMLSRVAERMYWFGRYVERAENTARLISVTTNLALDLPKAEFIWASLVSITGSDQAFASRFKNKDEGNVVRFLLDDPSGSIRRNVSMARENVRTTREILPNLSWDKINQLHHFLAENFQEGIKGDARHGFLADIMSACQEITGYLAGALSNNEAYKFIKIGRNLERADMTSRIIDVACLNLLNDKYPELQEYEDILWMNVLRSLTAFQMYRQHVKDRVNGEDVVDYLINDPDFPRSVIHCLSEVQASFEKLPNADTPLRELAHCQRMLASQNIIKQLNQGGLHEFIDRLQEDLGKIHQRIVATWFGQSLSASQAV